MPRRAELHSLDEVLHFASARLDARGLLPLDEARRRVAAAVEFSVGEHRSDGTHHWTDSDELWAALLSLETPEEFAREACRIRWIHWPRGWSSNVDPWIRFGDGVLVWVAACLSPEGDLGGPAGVDGCLGRIGTEAAWELVGRIAAVRGNPAGAEPLRSDWLRRHEAVAVACALARDPLDAWSEETLETAARTGNDEAARRLAERGRSVPRLRARDVLEELDRSYAAMEGGEISWPIFSIYDPSGCHHATRLVAAVRPGTRQWCILVQQVTGDGPETAEIDTYSYGAVAVRGWDEDRHASLGVTMEPEAAEDDPAADVTVSGPAGTCTIRASDLRDETLAPRKRDPRAAPNTSRLRVYLRRFRDRIWPDAAALAASSLRGEGPLVIVADTDRFRHRDFARPSGQPAYRALAKAIVAADPALFVPGEPNTWFDDPERRRTTA